MRRPQEIVEQTAQHATWNRTGRSQLVQEPRCRAHQHTQLEPAVATSEVAS